VFSVVAFVLLSSGCTEKKNLSDRKFARFYAKKSLLTQYYGNQKDSLDTYMAGLYLEENVSPEQIKAYIEEKEKEPEQWEKTQKLIVEELGRLEPAAARKTPKDEKGP
jgi:hypothetical protein